MDKIGEEGKECHWVTWTGFKSGRRLRSVQPLTMLVGFSGLHVSVKAVRDLL